MFSSPRYMLAAGLLSLLVMNVASEENAALAISPAELQFPAQAVDSAGPPQDLVLINQGSSRLEVSSILASGIDFSQSNNCEKPIAARASCSIQVVFKPATSGLRLGALQIAWSGTGSPRTIPLTGRGRSATEPIQP